MALRTAPEPLDTSPPTEPADRPGAALLRATAVVVQGDDVGHSFAIGARPLVVGSGADCDVRLADSSVSKRHLAVALVGASVHLRDLGSTNGTHVGVHRVVESLVPTGTIVRVGRTFLHLRGDDDALVVHPSEATGFGELRGRSIAMRQLYAVLERVAPTDATVFVDGETGTGKELVARAVHERSKRGKGPFVVLDCSSVAPELVESQLFGHRKGSFTGAVTDRAGVFEAATGGTLFLDEIDSLPADIQPKLLRVLESRRVVRVGDSSERPVDVRVIAASGRAPEGLAASGALRRDLYFRLAVVRITLPSLRDRVEDVPVLVGELLKRLGAEVAVEPGPTLDRLMQHAWPGNVRELRNVLERALALAPERPRSLADLPIALGTASAKPAGETFAELAYKEAKERVLERWEAEYLRAAFERNGHNLSAAAREVGLTRVHLRALLRRHGLA